MSSLPRRNRVTAAMQKHKQRHNRQANPMANIPVCSLELEDFLKSAKEIHQHQRIFHIVMAVGDNEACDVACLHCGGKTRIREPYAVEMDNTIFSVFKSFHVSCKAPEKPVGYFNVDMAVEDKRNPLFENKAGLVVELKEISVSKVDKSETYIFSDVKAPEVLLQMPAGQFQGLFTPKVDP